MTTVLTPDTTLAIALVEPQIPQNTGNIGRLCCCLGASLYIVGKPGFHIGDKHMERAGMDYLDQAPIHQVKDFEDLLNALPGWQPVFVETGATKSHYEMAYPEKTLLIFGSETTGLPQSIFQYYPDHIVTIPMRANVRSLNLSNAVAIVAYEVLRQHTVPNTTDASETLAPWG